MKVLGIIGGIGPESTIEYYRLIVKSYRERMQDESYPPVIINSIDLKRLLDLITSNELLEVTEYLLREIGRLASAGADFGLVAANTPHIVFDDLQQRSPIPLVSIIEAACEATKALRLKKVGLIGTRFTMKGEFYGKVFAREGITLTVPDEDAQAYIHDKYMNELIPGVFLPETRDSLLSIVDRMKELHGIEGVILGGTELPLILLDTAHNGVRFLDTTKIHVEAALTQMLS